MPAGPYGGTAPGAVRIRISRRLRRNRAIFAYPRAHSEVAASHAPIWESRIGVRGHGLHPGNQIACSARVARSVGFRLRDHLGLVLAMVLVMASVAIGAFRMGQRSARRAIHRAAARTEQTVTPPLSQNTAAPPVPTPAVPSSPSPPSTAAPAAAAPTAPAPDAGRETLARSTTRDAGPGTSVSREATESDSAIASAELVPDAGVEETREPRQPTRPGPVSCGSIWCAPGLVCCNASCGLCAPPGVVCSQRMCGVAMAPISVLCGMSTCNVGYVCCNASCGTCTRPGETCDQRSCGREMQFPTAEPCGFSTCNTGYECCNPSCGTCVRPGEPCSHEPCGW